MIDFKYIKDIFPQTLLKDIQETALKFKYAKLPGTVFSLSQEPEDINAWETFIKNIDTIQDIEPNINVLYNDAHENFNFSCLEGLQLYEAFKYYMKEEFDGYTLSRMHVNFTTKHPEYPINKHTIPHYDTPEPKKVLPNIEYKTVLFYVNTSDGNTVLFNVDGANHSHLEPSSKTNISNMGLKIIHEQPPIENSALVYSSGRLHAQRPNSKFDKRIVINIVLKKQ